ncbi:MAG: SWIM zinc finger domain-containing protein [Lachnospiraceae bacterium]|nr:SWIM zinc finger domain-containing protein [Lachnospiraceae bacterium]
MGLIDIASHKSIWRGIEYYKQNKVVLCDENNDGTYEAVVSGSDGEKYSVHLNIVHPRKSTCNCPLANGRQILCKHILATSFCVNPEEIDRFTREKTNFVSEEDERRTKRYEKYLSFAKSMSTKELRESYAKAMAEVEEMRNNLK